MGPSWNLGFICWTWSEFSLRMRSIRSLLTLSDLEPRTANFGLSSNWCPEEDFPVISIFHASARDESPAQKLWGQKDKHSPIGRPTSFEKFPEETRY